MELAKVTSKGQITIPVEIRKQLNLKPGDKVLFIEENGKITLANSSLTALSTIQQELSGAAEKAEIRNEEDVIQLVKEVRLKNGQ